MKVSSRILMVSSLVLLVLGYRAFELSSSLRAVKVLHSAPRTPESNQAENVAIPAVKNSTAPSGEMASARSLLNEKQKGDDAPTPYASTLSDKAVQGIESEADFQGLLANANLSTTITIAKTTQMLRAQDPSRIATYFSKTLEDLGQKDSDQRERLVFIANELQSDKLLPFWQDVIARKPARFEDETRYLDFGEPTEELQSIHLELLNSIRNIGLIALRDASAASFLSNLILHPSSKLHDDFIRERAFISLKEADLSQSIRVLKSLDPKDSLRARLIAP